MDNSSSRRVNRPEARQDDNLSLEANSSISNNPPAYSQFDPNPVDASVSSISHSSYTLDQLSQDLQRKIDHQEAFIQRLENLGEEISEEIRNKGRELDRLSHLIKSKKIEFESLEKRVAKQVQENAKTPEKPAAEVGGQIGVLSAMVQPLQQQPPQSNVKTSLV